jgi:uncharacterized protein YkwD
LRAERGAEPLKIDAEAVEAAVEQLKTMKCKDAADAETAIDSGKAVTCAFAGRRRLAEEPDCARNVWVNPNAIADEDSTTAENAVAAWFEYKKFFNAETGEMTGT